jgi:type I restriction enzyme S subunit
VSDLPIGWTTATISDVTKYLSRGKQPKYVSYSSLPVINQRAIRWNGIQNEHLKYVDPMQFDLWEPERFIQAGDILWNSTGTGTLGRAYLVTEQDLDPPKVVDSHVTILRPNQTAIDPRFLFFWIQSSEVQENIASLATGATNQIELGRAVIASMCIPFAPLNEQKRIADKLDSLLARVDACRDRLNKIPFIIKNFRCAVLNAAISGELTNDWRLERNRSIESWQQRNGSEVFPFITSGSRGWSSYYSTQGALFLRVGNLNHFTIDLDLNQIQYVNPPINAEGKRTRIEVGDILISITADVGMVAFISENVGEAYINQHLCLARQTGEHLGSYLAYFLSSPLGGIGQLTQMQRGATKAGLALNDIRSVKFLLPDLDEQYEIVSRIESLFAYADYCEVNYQNAFKILKQLTPVILDKAFCGELVSQDPNDEPASILLERIRAERIANLTTQKKQITKRRPKMSKMSSEAVKKEIFNLSNDKFSFDELHNHLHKQLLGDYDALKEILFTLLDEQPESIIAQRFDSEVEEMCFTRRQK